MYWRQATFLAILKKTKILSLMGKFAENKLEQPMKLYWHDCISTIEAIFRLILFFGCPIIAFANGIKKKKN